MLQGLMLRGKTVRVNGTEYQFQTVARNKFKNSTCKGCLRRNATGTIVLFYILPVPCFPVPEEHKFWACPNCSVEMLPQLASMLPQEQPDPVKEEDKSVVLGTLKQAAAKWGVSVGTVRNRYVQKRLYGTPKGGVIYVDLNTPVALMV